MSFLGRLLGRKRGGTRVGNFIRQWAYNNSQLTEGINIAGTDIKNVGTDGINADL